MCLFDDVRRKKEEGRIHKLTRENLPAVLLTLLIRVPMLGKVLTLLWAVLIWEMMDGMSGLWLAFCLA